MKNIVLLASLFLVGGCATDMGPGGLRVHTEREKPYYLGSDAAEMTDTCPGGDIKTI